MKEKTRIVVDPYREREVELQARALFDAVTSQW